jgi:hypothetical protein
MILFALALMNVYISSHSLQLASTLSNVDWGDLVRWMIVQNSFPTMRADGPGFLILSSSLRVSTLINRMASLMCFLRYLVGSLACLGDYLVGERVATWT